MSKKIVFIVVLIECILAVLLISLFGQAIYSSSPKLVNEVYFTYENGEKIADDQHLEVFLTDTKRDYQLFWAVDPENAHNTSVEFSSSDPNSVIVDASGRVTFRRTVLSVTITISTLDGGNKKDVIILTVNEAD